MSVSTIKLAEAHEKGLEKKRAQLAELDREVEDLTAAERVAMAEWISANPSRSPDATSQIGRYRSKIADAVARRERLVSEITAQEQLHEEIEGQASAEREALEAKTRAAEIKQAVEDLANAWANFCKSCEGVEATWEAVAELAMRLDDLPSGEARNGVLPTNIQTGFQLALAVPGQQPFAASPRIVAKRLSTTGGSAAMDVRGFSHTIRDTGDWRG